MSKVRLFGTMALGLVAGAGVGGLSVAAYLYITSETTPTIHNVTQDTTTDSSGISVVEHSVNGEFILGEEGRDILLERMKNDMGFGPELMATNSIVLAGMPAISSSSWGYYVPGAQVIVINIEAMSKNVSGDQYKNELVELIMQTLYHEYQHHVAAQYMNAVPNTHSTSTGDIYGSYMDGSKEIRYQQTWLSSYIDDFKAALTYDTDTAKYPAINLGDASNRIHSLGSVWNAKEIFDIANGSAIPEFDVDSYMRATGVSQVASLGTDYFDVSGGGFFGWTTTATATNWLSYQNSMDELFVRKNMQLKYIYDPSDLSTEFTSGADWGWYNKLNSDGIIAGVFRGSLGIHEDRTSYETTSDNYNTFDRYLSDAVYNGNQDMLNDAYNRVTGADTGADLSFVWYENDVDINYDSTDLRYVYSSSSIGKINNIKFGGYIDDSSFTHVTYQNNTGEWFQIPITIYDYKNGYKASVAATTWQDTPTDAFYYTTDSYISAEHIADNQLFFSKGYDGASASPIDATPLVGTRNSAATGNAADWRGSSPLEEHKDTFWTGVDDAGAISIREWDING